MIGTSRKELNRHWFEVHNSNKLCTKVFLFMLFIQNTKMFILHVLLNLLITLFLVWIHVHLIRGLYQS